MVTDQTIVGAAIHPGIGIARVGNSTAEGEEGYYIGPEVTDPDLNGVNNRDDSGAIKRQAARFRIYGYNAAGEVVKELNSSNTDEIQWTVHLANRKAQWYKFVVALDIPEWNNVPSEYRNPDIRGTDREQFVIDPGSRTIQGNDISGDDYKFDSGTFMSKTVPLGELRTDDAGRLLVLGGFGNSGSPTEAPIYNPNDPAGFLNPSGWYDDISDGPVTATVKIAGQNIRVESSWVAVAPPNYAPGIVSWRTLYDLLVDTYVESGWMPKPTKASFAKDILPVLSRLSNLQWVNKGFATLFGKGCPMDFSDPELIQKLARKPVSEEDDIYHELRQIVFNMFRPSETTSTTRSSWPWIYGDAFGSAPDSSPLNNLALSKVRMELMRLWVEGKFDNDLNSYTPPSCLDNVELQEQPAMLDKAALHFCLADAFHPGCELTWPMRHSTIYSAPFRIRHAANPTKQDYGTVLTQDIVLGPGGPLYAQGPGDLTRWMGIPWQADTGFCRSGYELEYDPYLPTFWPANVPNQVLTEENYQIVLTNPEEDEKLKAFYTREPWLRGLPSDTVEAMEYMVEHFAELGIIELRDGLDSDPNIPSKIFVESLTEEQCEKLRTRLAASERARLALPLNIRRAGWASVEQLEAFRRVRFGNR
ncbi:LodA/GoxA family CTQ-dependent oxidase [Moorena sp. SIO3I8]|uniref:LodA/GoxA family CTQ-dependent oxidase n=1 Tax=Moorena sp. SIO3I8 TaxID=2607833 RepID=UPI0025F45575|nr:LodA/GoxA family CTQ-dependent oxidase [Moorena sp. SIO3I8]